MDKSIEHQMRNKQVADLEMMRGYRVKQIQKAKEWIGLKNDEIAKLDARIRRMTGKAQNSQTRLGEMG